MKDLMLKEQLSKALSDVYSRLTRDYDTKKLDPFEAVEVIDVTLSALEMMSDTSKVWEESNNARGRTISRVLKWLDSSDLNEEQVRSLKSVIGEINVEIYGEEQ